MFAYICILENRLKKKVHISEIKKFNINKHVPNQKYKLVEGLKECVVLRFADSEEELDVFIEGAGGRGRVPSAKVLKSAAETTDEETQPIKRSTKRKADGSNVLTILNKRLEKLDHVIAKVNLEMNTSQSDAIQMNESTAKKSPNSIAGNKENAKCLSCEKLKEEVKSLEERIKSLYEEMSTQTKDLSASLDREIVLMDKLDKCLEEAKQLRELNLEWQKTAIEKHNNLLAIHKATVEAPRQFDRGGQYPPVGYITEDETQIHLGRGIYLSMQAWALALHVPSTRKATFAKNILVSLCGYDYLSKTTVTGRGSNRNKQTKKPETQLDPKILLAIRDIYTFYLVTEKKLKEEEAEIQAANVHTFISKKIASLKENKTKAYAKKPEKPTLGSNNSTRPEGDENSSGQEVLDVDSGIQSETVPSSQGVTAVISGIQSEAVLSGQEVAAVASDVTLCEIIDAKMEAIFSNAESLIDPDSDD